MPKAQRILRSWVKFLVWRLTGVWASKHSREDWDREYKTGTWRHLEEVGELGHYSVIAGYAQLIRPKAILDVACGSGVLARHLKALPYKHYLGIDLSMEAVMEASRRYGDERTRFQTADAREFASEQLFDLIVFNECLYYFRKPADVARHYSKLLAPGGKCIVSMFMATENRAIWRELEPFAAIEDAMTIRNQKSGVGWVIKLLSPYAGGHQTGNAAHSQDGVLKSYV